MHGRRNKLHDGMQFDTRAGPWRLRATFVVGKPSRRVQLYAGRGLHNTRVTGSAGGRGLRRRSGSGSGCVTWRGELAPRDTGLAAGGARQSRPDNAPATLILKPSTAHCSRRETGRPSVTVRLEVVSGGRGRGRWREAKRRRKYSRVATGAAGRPPTPPPASRSR
ncbi:hypothetical protein EVAR_80029_1 [Eumeta japonica]|uniref:Uncharacterized protein n=1 Tax=Eumeta variegata TaxID=151549 RepID=A0A4C1WPB7_EUMVA|nr:hypothetical protein EVAR_80029_1 [Eumeta japonica]